MLREMKAYPQIVFNFAPPQLHLDEIKNPQSASVGHVFWRFGYAAAFSVSSGKMFQNASASALLTMLK